MKKISKILSVALVASTALTLGACTDGETDTKPDITVPNTQKELNLDKTSAKIMNTQTINVSFEAKNLTGDMVITGSNDNARFATKGNLVTITAQKVGEYKLTFTQDGITKEFNLEITPFVEKDFSIDVHQATIQLGTTLDVKVKADNLEGNLEVSLNNDTVTYTNSGNDFVFTGVKQGTTVVTFSQDGYSATLTIVVQHLPAEYAIYKTDGTIINVEDSKNFYAALDDLMLVAAESGATIRDINTNEVKYTHSPNLHWNFMNSEGLTNDILPESIINNGSIYGSYGQTLYWDSYRTDTAVYTQNKANILSTQYIPTFIARQSEFNLAFNDGNSGFVNNPNDIWGGWSASVYRAGLSVAQYAGWADLEVSPGKALDQFTFTYDLSEGEMKPSQNKYQPTRADIWLGSSNLEVCDDVLMGVTFDAGSIETTKDLQDGETRSWYLFTEALDGINSTVQKTRTLSTDSIGTATWDKTNGVWIHDFNITLDLKITTNEDGHLVRVLTGSVGNEEVTMEVNQGKAAVNLAKYRFTYGVNYTPDHSVNSRKVPDLQNGGYWTGVKQENVSGLIKGEVVRNYDFLAGRSVNNGNQLGLYGCDVVSASSVNGKTIFEFNY